MCEVEEKGTWEIEAAAEGERGRETGRVSTFYTLGWGDIFSMGFNCVLNIGGLIG